jgi:hypothetical protein
MAQEDSLYIGIFNEILKSSRFDSVFYKSYPSDKETYIILENKFVTNHIKNYDHTNYPEFDLNPKKNLIFMDKETMWLYGFDYYLEIKELKISDSSIDLTIYINKFIVSDINTISETKIKLNRGEKWIVTKEETKSIDSLKHNDIFQLIDINTGGK